MFTFMINIDVKFRFKTALLPPANEVCEGYVFTPVCQSFCSWGEGGSASVHAGIPPGTGTPRRRPPQGVDTTLPRTGTPLLEQTPPRTGTPWEQTAPHTVHAGRCGQQAGGMHPTRMQSC